MAGQHIQRRIENSFRLSIAVCICVISVLVEAALAGEIIYVKQNAGGINDGTSWPDAFIDVGAGTLSTSDMRRWT